MSHDSFWCNSGCRGLPPNLCQELLGSLHQHASKIGMSTKPTPIFLCCMSYSDVACDGGLFVIRSNSKGKKPSQLGIVLVLPCFSYTTLASRLWNGEDGKS